MSRPDPIERFSREAAAGYDRQVIEEAQVILFGCGALGQFVALLLSLIGVRHVVFVDKDHFEESNICRSPFYKRGALKAAATAEGACKRCTDSQPDYRFFAGSLQTLGDAIFSMKQGRKVVIITAVDELLARAYVAQRCRYWGVPEVTGGFRGEEHCLAVYSHSSGEKPCFACDKPAVRTESVLSCRFYAKQALAQQMIPATAPGAANLASLMVAQVIALMHDRCEILDRRIYTDMASGTARQMILTQDENCLLDHTVAHTQAKQLQSTTDTTVCDFLTEIGKIAPEPIVELPSTFVLNAPCSKCRGVVRLAQPEWNVATAPTCTECGGNLPKVRGYPQDFTHITDTTDITDYAQQIQSLSLKNLGIGPGTILKVQDEQEEESYVRISDAGFQLETV